MNVSWNIVQECESIVKGEERNIYPELKVLWNMSRTKITHFS